MKRVSEFVSELFIGLALLITLLSLATEGQGATQAQEPQQAKKLSGMSIVGNDEAPKSLYIVPWKSSEIGVETSLHMVLNKDAVPEDRDVFKRQLDFYEVSTATEMERK